MSHPCQEALRPGDNEFLRDAIKQGHFSNPESLPRLQVLGVFLDITSQWRSLVGSC